MSTSPATSNAPLRNGEWSPQTDTTSSPIPPQHASAAAAAPPRKRRRTNTTTATAAATNILPTRYAINMETGLMRDGESPGLPRFVGSGSGIHFVRNVYDILARSMAGGGGGGDGGGSGLQPSSQLVPGEDDQLDDHQQQQQQQQQQQRKSSPGTLRARAPFWRDEVVAVGDECAGAGAGAAPQTTTTSTTTSWDFHDLVRWTRRYFEIWHPAFPFLHGPEALGLLELVAARGIEHVSAPDAAIVRAMVSLSLADARQLGAAADGGAAEAAVPAELVFWSLDHAASCVGFVLATPASLKNLQAALCVELFLVSMLKFNMASRLGGAVVRMAYHLGLHRCPRRYTNFTAHEVAMRKRIWWSFYCLERLVCQVLGLPLDVQDDDVDVCFPAAELHPRTPEQEMADSQEESGQLQLLTMLSKHAQLRGMILELRHKTLCIRQDSIETALEVQSRLMKWANEVHEIIGNGDDDGSAAAVMVEDSGLHHHQDGGDDDEEYGQIPPIYRKLFVVLQHESTITLNRPLLARRPATTASKAALQSCIHASRAIIETVDDVQVFSNNNNNNTAAAADKDSVAVPSALAVWPLLTWSVWMSCFILTYAALEGVTSVSSTQRYARRTLRILQHLSLRGTTWPDSCAEAVRHLLAALERHPPPEDDVLLPPDQQQQQQQQQQLQPQQQQFNSNQAPQNSVTNGSQRAFEDEPMFRRGAASRNGWQGQQQQQQHQQQHQPPSAGVSQNGTPARMGVGVGVGKPEQQPSPAYGASLSNSDANQQAPPDFSGGIPQTSSTTTTTSHLAAAAAGFPPGAADFTLDLSDQSWLLDPLSALDFSKFAQAGSAESAMGFTFY